MRIGTWNRGRIWISNGKVTKHILPDQPIPEGFKKGRTGFRARPKNDFTPSEHPLYDTWTGMIHRCYNARARQYTDYGGRGIKVTFRWRRSFVCFAYDVAKEIGKKPEGRSRRGKRSQYVFDRIRNDEGYKPGNIQWSTYSESNYNRRGARLTIQQRKEIEQLLQEGRRYEEINRLYGTNTVYQIAVNAGLTYPRVRRRR